jgi:hypothetical protein
MWRLDEAEAGMLREAIGSKDVKFPLLATLADLYEDFECTGARLLGLAEETLSLELNLEEQQLDRPRLIRLLNLVGGLAALAHDHQLGIFGYLN